MPTIARPSKVYDFTAHARRQPTAPPPGDRLDAQLANHADAITAVQLAVERLAQTVPQPIDIEAPARAILAKAESAADEIRRASRDAAAIVDQAKLQLTRIWAEADRARDVADRAEARLAAAVLEAQAKPVPAPQFSNGPASQAMPSLGYGAGGFYASDDAGAAAVSADYAQVAIEWAEHLPDTIPPNILAINAISGQHWSSRWWALRSANAFGMMAWWYMGAWPGPPPTTPLTPTGDPIPPGGMYFDTISGKMFVWNGSGWVPLAQGPAAATTSSLYYVSAAGQTVFPLAALDHYGKSFTFNQTAPEGIHTLVNGVRLAPTDDYAVNTVSSTVTLARPVSVNAVVGFDILTPVSQLSPSGSVNTVLVSPIVPDGIKVTFTGLTVASNGHPVNVAKNEELLVSVDGVQQSPGSSYNASGASITFSQAPDANSLIFIVWFGPAVTTFSAPVTSVWSPDDAAAGGMTLSNGGLTATNTNTNIWKTLRGSISKTSGKAYIEFLCVEGPPDGNSNIGLASASFNAGSYLGSSNYSGGATYGATPVSTGFMSNYTTLQYPVTNDVWGLAVDFATGKMWLAKNNVWLNSSDPATGALPILSFVPATVGALFPGVSFYDLNDAWTLQPTAASQKYAPPSGFSPWDAP